MALHKNITPSQLADGNLELIGGSLHHARYDFLYHEYIRMLHKIPSEDYVEEVETYLQFKNNN
jgi:menaquinone-dependent protoporphyrinogen IX oxidase|tara:strand:- start:2322 stop:2510 length:189 start_codon:yes stop_codon:yes gene_type:complete